ncbi:2-dehydropantoate 2-reductase [Azospirillum lipoferum]|uniref:2-dehydropantoate 2-reductase n=1 Tax=Azospirillum lipoferum TaxID=193 RepID=A0A5A9GC83_AZOLI|nr:MULTISPECIES: 2-dehydropantoate 2-reductase [Azospirillum]KAA0592063.1 2-dehydropantoate 2-reductase [Azospirillum lipoferum]MCP1612057.1 2-dehydropantoate 2-reductase [Azospirillum lipoferum]MDW5536715.1 2-dehydropantoate 2-reductase [Azospirillum sp. NL1]
MKTCIIGAGAIGGLIGIRLAQAGCDVSVLARGATADALRAGPWRLATADGQIMGSVRVADDLTALGPQDLVVIAVKGQSLPGLAQSLTPLIGTETMVLPAMNGVPWWFFHRFGGPLAGMPLDSVDPGRRIADAIPDDAVVGCVVHATCSVAEPGLVRHGFGKRLIVGELDSSLSARLGRLADCLTAAGFEVQSSTRIQADIWYKLWGNMTMNPVSALTGATCDRILDDPLVSGFCLSVMAEAAELGRLIGCPIEQSGQDRNAVTRRLGAFKTSMLQDTEAGKPLEIDALLGAVKEIAGRLGQATPNLDALLGLTRLMAGTRGLYPAMD